MHIIDIIEDKCTGCGACVLVCPPKALTLVVDKEGFEVPEINLDLCINCEKCIECCHAINQNNSFDSNRVERVFYGWNNSDEERRKSSSGGIFVELANYIKLKNGLVYGAVYDKEAKKIIHSCDYSLDETMRSKYVQSSTIESFKEVRSALRENKTVLYCGTPCQIGALYKICDKYNPNLITVDFICHGVPSPGVFKDYLQGLENKYKSVVEKGRI